MATTSRRDAFAGWRQGFLSNITNPKVLVFYLAVLRPGEYRAIMWLRRAVKGTPVVLEAQDGEVLGLDRAGEAPDEHGRLLALAAALAAEGISTTPSPLSPLILTVISGNAFASALFAAGHVPAMRSKSSVCSPRQRTARVVGASSTLDVERITAVTRGE